ncbi:MAG: DUF4340 domain-containing protein [Anaerolineales bacterium]|nr:DUF4340 domain-containing protein [Anaerolineales bacterium]
MDRRITYGLLIALVVLIALAGLMDSNILQPAPTEPGSVSPTLAPLWSVDAASINLIRIEDLKSGTHVEVQKNSAGTWMVMDIPSVEAEQAKVTSALDTLAKMQIYRDYGENLKPEEYNLDKPLYKLTVKTAEAKTFVLEIGAPTPTGTGYYVRLEGAKNIVGVRSSFLSPIIDFLTNKPLPATATPTFTITPTVTATPTITPTYTLTPTITETPTVTPTPETPVPSVTPTPTT